MSSEAVTRIQVGGTAGSDPYEVLIGRQLLEELGGLAGEKAGVDDAVRHQSGR